MQRIHYRLTLPKYQTARGLWVQLLSFMLNSDIISVLVSAFGVTSVNETLHVYLRRNEAFIRDDVPNLPKSLSGSHGNLPKRTIVSVLLLQFRRQKLDDLVTPIDYTFTNIRIVWHCINELSLCSPSQITFVHCYQICEEFWKYCEGDLDHAAYCNSLNSFTLAPQLPPEVISSQDEGTHLWSHSSLKNRQTGNEDSRLEQELRPRSPTRETSRLGNVLI